MPSTFAKTGYNRNTHRALLYGPTDYAGGGFLRWKWLQGEGQITNFLKYWRTNGQVSKTLRVAVSWYQYEAGVSWSLFEDIKTSVKYTSARWISSLRNFLATIDGHFDLDDVYISTPPQCEHDIHLMDLVTHSKAFTEKEAAILNHCRMYLDVTTVSDISIAKGDMFIPGVEWGGLDMMPSRTTEHTSHQQAPAIFLWTYWQRLLRAISNPQGKLFGQLGNWLEL
jgi:hypothetical protein